MVSASIHRNDLGITLDASFVWLSIAKCTVSALGGCRETDHHLTVSWP